LLFLILIFGLALRLYGLNWDQGFHLHPDERFLTMVGTAIRWPRDLGHYLDTQNSPLNPYNNGYDFFVYGQFPLFITKATAAVLGLGNYFTFNLVGRVISAIFDLGVVALLYLISRALWPSVIYSLMVLPIQLSHFFAVDTFLNFFLVLSFYLALKRRTIFSGIAFGLALACKISALLFLPIIMVIIWQNNKKEIKKFFWNSGCFLLFVFVSFRFFSPYSFSSLVALNPQFIDNLRTLKTFDDPKAWFPPAVQWIKTKPIIFPAINLLFWGLGLPLGIIVILALPFSIRRLISKKKLDCLSLALIWSLFLFFFQGVQFVKTMRYFLPIYPFLALLAGDWLAKVAAKNLCRSAQIFAILLAYPLMFINIYSRPHTRVRASRWIFENIPAGSVLSCEHWDDCLPLSLVYRDTGIYQIKTLHLYDSDTREKWLKISNQLERIDYLILSSNRLWGSIPKTPERYPVTAKYYRKLFAGELGFKKVIEFTSCPGFRVLSFRFQVNDDWAEEAFTVYDHPKVMIFRNTKKFVKKDFLEQLLST